ncbi:MAG: BrxA family protein [Desulfatibacillaceae bacterium]
MAKKKNQHGRKMSTRLIRKGALVEETYNAFRTWDLSVDFRKNIEKMREENPFGASSEQWLREILTTLSSRFGADSSIAPLIILAQRGLGIEAWKACLLWHVGRIDELYYRWAIDWLFDQYQAGTYLMRTDDVVPFVRKVTHGRIASGGDLSEYGALRAARDLLRMAADFGLLDGSVKKSFANYHIPEQSFVYVLHALADQGGSAARIPQSKDWRLYLMDRADVERELYRLHQFRVLDYQVAGSIAHLKLPYASLRECAEELSL